jgi:ribosomal protein S18 acetylase RimI-like enzyme
VNAVLIREFNFHSDYEPACDLWKNAGPGVGFGKSDTPEEISKKLQRDPDLFLVAEEEGQLIGTVIGGFDGRRGMVYHLAVKAAYRRKGIGQMLMNELENRMRVKGCLKYYLLVKPGNIDAMAFYEKHGWKLMDVALYGKELN